MKASALLIAVIVMLHCAALGALFFIQGCGTTSRTGTPSSVEMPPMPPTTKESVNYPPPTTDAKSPVVKPVSKDLPKASETTEYVVRSGDTLGGIAKQYGISRSEIVDLNKMSDPNKLRVGQKLLLPGHLKIKSVPAKQSAKAPKSVKPVAASAEPLVPAPAEAGATLAPVAGKEYVVVVGDSLSKIAKKCGVKISALRAANKLQGDNLKIGQKLIIPEATAIPVVSPAVAVAAPVAVAEPAAVTPGVEAPAAAPAGAVAPVVSPTTAPVAPAAAASSKTISNSGITHTVQKIDGKTEDLASIAQLYVVTEDGIVELNQLGANRTLKVGQQLKIP